MSDFTAGLAVRRDALASALIGRFVAPASFAAVDPATRCRPRHYRPADRTANPTAGWDPLACDVGETVIDPLVAAHAAGYAEGLAAAAAQQAAGGLRDDALLAALAAALTPAIDRDRLAERLRGTVLALVGRLVGEAGISADLLGARIEAACDLLADPGESALLRLHPDDVALVEGRLPASVFAAGDPHVARGSFALESASTVVEDGPALWLDQLAGAIDRVPLPSCPAPSC